MAVTAFAVKEINRSYSELPWRLIGDLLMKSAARDSGPRLASKAHRAKRAELD